MKKISNKITKIRIGKKLGRFSKNEDDNIDIQIVSGATTIDFTYVDMVKELMVNNSIEEPVFDDGAVSEDEKERIKTMLKKISEVISEVENDDESEIETTDFDDDPLF